MKKIKAIKNTHAVLRFKSKMITNFKWHEKLSAQGLELLIFFLTKN